MQLHVTPPEIVTAGVLAGVGGWIIDNAYSLPRPPGYSWIVGGPSVGLPILPVYAVGGMGIAAAAPHLHNLSAPERFVLYAAGMTALEYGACKAERAMGRQSWDYQGACVDVPHALAWGALAMVAEQIVLRLRGQ